jgi:hypothetical protein
MYVRWKKRARSSYHRPTGDYTLSAYLVSSHRVGSQPRQKATYLACIWDKYIDAVMHRHKFWQYVDWKLDSLNLSVQERAAIESKLAQTVQRVTPEQVEFELRHRHAHFGH